MILNEQIFPYTKVKRSVFNVMEEIKTSDFGSGSLNP
jgi:hypothetical protein